MQRVWFHGTNKNNIDKIRKNGFKIGTYFARHMEDAVKFGGPYVFSVNAVFKPRRRNNWQVTCANAIPRTSIIGYCYVQGTRKLRKSLNNWDFGE